MVFTASARKGSLNKKLARVASESAGESGADVTLSLIFDITGETS